MNVAIVKGEHGQSTTGKVFVSSCFIFILFLSSFDAFAVEGIVPLIEENFNINDAQTAVIRTSSSVASTATLALTWLFGDVFERKKLFISSVGCWIAFSLLSVLLGSESFLIFVGFRSLASAASNVYAVLIPVLLADLFEDRSLGIALMCATAVDGFSMSIMGILNSWIVTSGVPWQSGLLIGPLVMILPVIGLTCARSAFLRTANTDKIRSVRRSFLNAFGIFSIKSYVLITLAISFGLFNVRSFLFWLPTMMLNAWTAYPDAFLGFSYTTIISVNSVIQIVGGFLGPPAFLWFAQSWRHGTGPFAGRGDYLRAYPIVVGFGATIMAMTITLGLVLFADNYILSVVVMFICGIAAGADTSLTQQMMLMVVPSSSRAAAVALSRLASAIISTPAAQLTGYASDTFRGDSTDPIDRFHAYQKALICASTFAFANALCDIILIAFFPGDCEKAAEKDREEGEINEKTALIKATKIRSESLLDSVIRSRAGTVLSNY